MPKVRRKKGADVENTQNLEMETTAEMETLSDDRPRTDLEHDSFDGSAIIRPLINKNNSLLPSLDDSKLESVILEEPEVFSQKLLDNLEIIKNIGVDNNGLSVFGIKNEQIEALGLNIDRKIVEKKSDPPIRKTLDFGRSKSENEVFKLQGVNLNPYLNYQDLQIKSLKNKENIVNEHSFFTPELMGNKHASTPINYYAKEKFSRVSILNSSKIRRNNRLKQRKRETMLSKTAPPALLTSRTISPSACNISIEGVAQGSETNAEGTEKANSSPIMEQMLEITKKFCFSLKNWVMSLISLYGYAAPLKSSLRLLYTFGKKTSDSQLSVRQEIDKMNAKMENIEKNLNDIKTLLMRNDLEENLEKVSSELNAFKSWKVEVEKILKNHDLSQASILTTRFSQVPSAPPPPPPPLPPPPSTPTPALNLSKSMKKDSTKKENEGFRPTIHLDDILKVKLRKPTERLTSTRRANSTQPIVTSDMLKQVKLRKFKSARLSLPDSTCELSTSPCSSLQKLLKDDTSFRIKRLRRVGAHSFDDYSRRNLSALNEEREK